MTVHVPHYFREIVEQIAFEARESEYIDQKSGVSARLTRAALEDLISAAERRALLTDETETTVRIGDLAAVEPAITGKVELVYEGEQEGAQSVAQMLIGKAVATIFTRYFPDPSDKEQGRASLPARARVVLEGEHARPRPGHAVRRLREGARRGGRAARDRQKAHEPDAPGRDGERDGVRRSRRCTSSRSSARTAWTPG